MTETKKSPVLSALEAAARAAKGGRGLPPVHKWNPPDCGDIDMRIKPDGSWMYMGSPITRPAMVRLFSTILRRDGARYVLVTPVEKLGIVVEDAPFVAVEVELVGKDDERRLVFRTNVDDVVSANAAHPIRVEENPRTKEPRPYLLVRDGLEALISRSVFYTLADLAEERIVDGKPVLGVVSEGAFFSLGGA